VRLRAAGSSDDRDAGSICDGCGQRGWHGHGGHNGHPGSRQFFCDRTRNPTCEQNLALFEAEAFMPGGANQFVDDAVTADIFANRP